ncbi:MAG: S-adenosylmethionine:tRNA ribosyltransferase-isomerase [Bacteroidales bacterium]|nr:S-adenosylmethionine:tRNA ribosyltransferase-isomerase [Bacteroidales bacterium]
MNPKEIHIEDYDYPLPEERIAKFPLEERDSSKLLVYENGVFSDDRFSNIAGHLPEGALLVFNDTKVIRARMMFRKGSGALIEIFCLEPWQMSAAQSFEQRSEADWLCFIGNNRKWKEGALSRSVTIQGKEVILKAERLRMERQAWVVRFSWDQGISFAEVMEAAGEVPLPPYLHRDAEESDKERYQTIYARFEGSVAAPTAGLHFTPAVFGSLERKSIDKEFVTLHVGAGTFKPVSTELVGEHEMHVEKISVTPGQIRRLMQQAGKPLVAVGTTTARTLESLYWFGVQLSENPETESMLIGQWFPYAKHPDLPATDALQLVLEYLQRHGLPLLEGETKLMIAPGYRFRIINGLITNFHQPKSTLLLLVSALVGDVWRDGYRYALEHGFRFLSYGDSCLFLP